MTRQLAHYQLTKRLANSDVATFTEVIDALHRLHYACQEQLYNHPHESRGRVEYITAMRQARQVLQRTRKYGEADRG